jgi:hypothetical protein
MNFFINDPDAGKILGTERGLPANTDIRTAVSAALTDANMKATVDFENAITPKFGKAPNVPPNGAAAVRTLLIQEAEKVQFGQMDSAAAPRSSSSRRTSSSPPDVVTSASRQTTVPTNEGAHGVATTVGETAVAPAPSLRDRTPARLPARKRGAGPTRRREPEPAKSSSPRG